MVTFGPLISTYFMNIKTAILSLALCLFLFAPSCKDDDGGVNGPNTSTGKLTDADKENLYDVVWHPSGGGLELEFLSTGTFRQSLSLEGTYNWQNKGDTMNVTDHNDKKFNMLFLSISSTSMQYKTDLLGDGFKTTFTYNTTK